jgi:hypothetical protein
VSTLYGREGGGRRREREAARRGASGQVAAARRCLTGPPRRAASRTKWTRRVPHPVLIGHASQRFAMAAIEQALPEGPGRAGTPTLNRHHKVRGAGREMRVRFVRGERDARPVCTGGERYAPGSYGAGREMRVRFVRGGAEMCARFAWLPPPKKKQNLIPPPLPLLQASRVQELREFDEYERADSQQVRPKSSADSARAPEV